MPKEWVIILSLSWSLRHGSNTNAQQQHVCTGATRVKVLAKEQHQLETQVNHVPEDCDIISGYYPRLTASNTAATRRRHSSNMRIAQQQHDFEIQN